MISKPLEATGRTLVPGCVSGLALHIGQLEEIPPHPDGVILVFERAHRDYFPLVAGAIACITENDGRELRIALSELGIPYVTCIRDVRRFHGRIVQVDARQDGTAIVTAAGD